MNKFSLYRFFFKFVRVRMICPPCA